MDLTPQDLWTLRNILINAIKETHEVLATAARRSKAEQSQKPPGLAPAPETPSSERRSVVQPRLAYTMKDAAQLLSLSRSTLYRLIGEGVIPTFQFGGRRLIKAADLEAVISNGQVRR